MTGDGVSGGDMPNFPWLSRPDVPPIGDASWAALLAGDDLPAGSPPELRPVSETLAALRGGPASDELAGEAAALAAFRAGLGVSSPARRPRRRLAVLSSLPARAAAAATVAVLSLGGLAAAAFAGALPSPLQTFAHTTFGAPAAAARTGGSPSPSGPGPAGHAAYGLCTAWAHAKAHGTGTQKAVAFRNLAAAAGGAGRVGTYCATVPHPGAAASSQPHGHSTPISHPTPHGHSKPTSNPTPHGHSTPASHPTPHGHGKPTSSPTPHGSGKPTSKPAPNR
jgi:hypothetical protein